MLLRLRHQPCASPSPTHAFCLPRSLNIRSEDQPFEEYELVIDEEPDAIPDVSLAGGLKIAPVPLEVAEEVRRTRLMRNR